MATTSIIDHLDALDLHHLLAVSGGGHLLIRTSGSGTFNHALAAIKSFSASPNIRRSLRIVPPSFAQTVESLPALQEQCFLAAEDAVSEQQVAFAPSTLVIPNLDKLATHVQRDFKSVIRERRITHSGQTVNLPDNFLLIAVVEDWQNLSHALKDSFGLSLDLASPPGQRSVDPPPSVPLEPAATYMPMLRIYAADVLSALRHHQLVDNRLLTAHCSYKHLVKVATLWVRLKTYDSSVPVLDSTSSYASHIELRPDDIAQVLTSCVLHRLDVKAPEQWWQKFWDKSGETAEAREAYRKAKREGIRPQMQVVIEEILSKV